MFKYLKSVIPILIACGCCCPTVHYGPQDPPAPVLEQATFEAESAGLISRDPIPCEEWWSLFNDSQLNCFISEALEQNPTLQSAVERIYAAQANADKIRSVLYPQINWAGDIGRNQLSKTGIIPNPVSGNGIPIEGAPRVPFSFTQYETSLTLNYDIDVWGKNRAALCAALDLEQAALADEAFARLTLSIAIAQTYYKLQVAYQRELLAKQLVKNRTRFAEIVHLRVQKHLNDQQSYITAQNDLESAKISLLQIQAIIALAEDQLRTYLAGDFTEVICPKNITQQPIPEVPVPCNLPLHLIAHRPDIISQLWIIDSAGKQIYVAHKGFYPDFNLTGFIGYQTIHFREWFQSDSVFGMIDPAVSLPLFDGGYLTANLRGSEVNYDLAILRYNELVLKATQEVLDSLTLLTLNDKQLAVIQDEVANQERIFSLTENRIKHNIGSNLDYLEQERALILAKDRAIVAAGASLDSVLALIKAVGGGYESCLIEKG